MTEVTKNAKIPGTDKTIPYTVKTCDNADEATELFGKFNGSEKRKSVNARLDYIARQNALAAGDPNKRMKLLQKAMQATRDKRERARISEEMAVCARDMANA